MGCGKRVGHAVCVMARVGKVATERTIRGDNIAYEKPKLSTLAG
jgi:hypothetical protein